MRTAIVTEAVELVFEAGVAQAVNHGLGREPAGFLVIWSDEFCRVKAVESADKNNELLLVCDVDAVVRLVLLS